MRDLAGPREYKVKNIDAYYEGVVQNLRAKGFCAGFDLAELQVKNTNDFNDQYDIMISQGYVRRGAGLVPLDLLAGGVPARPRGRDRPGARRLLRAALPRPEPRARPATARARSPSTASAT